jgi:hypothetical protein
MNCQLRFASHSREESYDQAYDEGCVGEALDAETGDLLPFD